MPAEVEPAGGIFYRLVSSQGLLVEGEDGKVVAPLMAPERMGFPRDLEGTDFTTLITVHE